MKNFLSLTTAVITSTTIGIISVSRPITAASFDRQEIEQNKFVALTVHHVSAVFQLMILEQISDSQACWREN